MIIDPTKVSVPELHHALLGAIAPRPIAFVSTLNAKGQPNLAPFSFFNVFSANPPVAIFSPARRGRDNTTKHTYENALIVPECVINIVNYAIVQQCSIASSDYPEGISEFEKAGLTPIASQKVSPPRVKESPVQLECKITQVTPLGSGGGAGNLVMCEVVLIHIDDHVLDAQGKIDPAKMDQVARMGGSWYTRAKTGMFELPQPAGKICIGMDQVPASIRHSKFLSGFQLGQLASVYELPDETSVNEYKLTELAELFIEMDGKPELLENSLHERAAQLLDGGKIAEAWMSLLAFND